MGVMALPKLRVTFFEVSIIIRVTAFWAYIRAPIFWETAT